MEGLALGTVFLVAMGAFLLLFLLWAVPVGLWVTAFASGVRVKLLVSPPLSTLKPRGQLH